MMAPGSRAAIWSRESRAERGACSGQSGPRSIFCPGCQGWQRRHGCSPTRSPAARQRSSAPARRPPGLRTLEKQAVRLGGGANHRFGLDDAMLIKDNHIALAGGVRAALERARRHAGHLVKIELEVDTLDQLAEALEVGVDAVLLDNMTPEDLRRAVAMVDDRAVTEASGRITLETAAAVAATGVDLISSGWITHSAPILDLGLDIAD